MSEKIGIIGLGYVGLPVAMAFAERFDDVVGFDIDGEKIASLLAGTDVTAQFSHAELKATNLHFVEDSEALRDRTFFIITVPTPIDEHKRPDLSPLIAASTTVGHAITRGAVVVYESTVYPGVTEEICGPVLEKISGLKAGIDFFLGYSPERINPGDNEHSFTRIKKVVSGSDAATLERLAASYGAVITAGIYRAESIKVAEAAKVIENAQRDLNIALMNELALIFDRLGIATKDVLRAASTKWNFLPFSPGLVGGHCIGVDPYYLTSKAEQLGYQPEVILAGRRINDRMGAFIAQKTVKLMIHQGISVKGARVGVLGLTFKENVPDLRNSRVPDIVRELQSFGIDILIHDPLSNIDEALKEYELKLAPLDAFLDLDALILAVPHRAYLSEDRAKLPSFLRLNGVFIDVKSCLSQSDFPAPLFYWQL